MWRVLERGPALARSAAQQSNGIVLEASQVPDQSDVKGQQIPVLHGLGET